jgi:4-amino-4-deoxy-L-arabinose transferase-like glycosyltransferase
MTIVAIRVFIFTVLPLLFALAFVLFDRNTRSQERRVEVFLIFLLALGVAGSGIGGFFAHLFLSDMVADSVGWPAGNPFQLEVGFANLAVGVLGILAVGRRDGFREATVIAATIFSVGATVIHLLDIVQTGNLAPGNTLQNADNLVGPIFLIIFLAASRRLERAPGSEVDQPAFGQWHRPRAQAAGAVTGAVATGFGLGFAVNQPIVGTLLGMLGGVILTLVILVRAQRHRAGEV